MTVILMLILLGVVIAYAIDRIYINQRFRSISLTAEDDEVSVLRDAPLRRILSKSDTYEHLKRNQEVHRGRSMPRSRHRRHHLAQARDGRDGEGILPPSK